MSRSTQLRLDDIIEACAQVEEYVRNYDQARFAADNRTQDAVIRQFEVIGEAVKALPESMKAQEPEIPWRVIAGFRDVLAHAYFNIEVSVVWDAATKKAPVLRQACQRLRG